MSNENKKKKKNKKGLVLTPFLASVFTSAIVLAARSIDRDTSAVSILKNEFKLGFRSPKFKHRENLIFHVVEASYSNGKRKKLIQIPRWKRGAKEMAQILVAQLTK